MLRLESDYRFRDILAEAFSRRVNEKYGIFRNIELGQNVIAVSANKLDIIFQIVQFGKLFCVVNRFGNDFN